MKIKFLVAFLLINICSFGQDTLRVEEVFPKNFKKDHIGNTYHLVQLDTLIKKSSTLDTQQTYSYSNTRLGEITSYNIQNPLKIIINHNEMATLVFTDNTLRETNRIFLPDLEIYSNEVAFAQAYDNSLWVYDDNNAQLLRVNAEGQVLSRTPNLIQDIGEVPVVETMQTNDNYIVLEDENLGLIVCDQFGEYIKTIPLQQLQHWLLKKDRIIYVKNDKLKQYPIEGVLLP